MDPVEKLILGVAGTAICFIILVGAYGCQQLEGIVASCEAKGGVYVKDLCLRKDAVIE